MKPFFGGVGEEALKSSLLQRRRGTAEAVDEEDEFHTNYI